MRILVLETPARDEHVRLDQGLDHRLVGIALLAFVIDDTLSGKPGRGLGEGAIFIYGVGNCRVDAALFECGTARGPDLKVLTAMPGRGVDEAGAGIVGHML